MKNHINPHSIMLAALFALGLASLVWGIWTLPDYAKQAVKTKDAPSFSGFFRDIRSALGVLKSNPAKPEQKTIPADENILELREKVFGEKIYGQ